MLLITVIPLTVLSMALNINTKRFYEQNMKNLYLQMYNQYAENLKYKSNNYASMVASVVSLGSVGELLDSGASSFSEIYAISSRLSDAIAATSTHYNNNNEMNNIMIFSLVDDLPIYTSKIVTHKDSLHFNLINEENIARGYYVHKSVSGRNLISFLYPILSPDFQSGRILAYFIVEINLDRFFRFAYDNYADYAAKVEIDVSDRDGQSIWRSAQEHADPSAAVYTIEKENFLNNWGWTLTMRFYSGDAGASGGYQYTLIFTTLILIVLGLIASFLFSRRIDARIGLLINKINRVKAGDLSQRTPIAGSDEFTAIDESFNNMVEMLDIYINENLLQRIAYNEAQLNILQNQINPHFLYNTLEVIDSMASTTGNFEICDVCHRLGQIFRYNVSGSGREYVCFEQELNHVKNYAAIQQTRFANRIGIEYIIDPACEQVRVLKFILQPLVENAFSHALEAKGAGGLLRITAQMRGQLCIEIQDNGAGFDARKLREIQRFVQDPLDSKHIDFSGGIGLKNVISRIKLVYGDQAEITIQSANTGTKITLCLPDLAAGDTKGGGMDV